MNLQIQITRRFWQLALPAYIAAICLNFSVAVSTHGLTNSLIGGYWLHQGDKTIIGTGRDDAISLNQSNGQWFITFHQIVYRSVNDKNRRPLYTNDGPFAVSMHDNLLVFTNRRGYQQYTFQLETNRLTMPAFVEAKPGTWSFENGNDGIRLQCASNHLIHPVGRAYFPSSVNNNGYYVYEELPGRSFTGKAHCLRFMLRNPEGKLEEECRLVFDDWGWPRFQGTNPSRSPYHERFVAVHYLAASPPSPPR